MRFASYSIILPCVILRSEGRMRSDVAPLRSLRLDTNFAQISDGPSTGNITTVNDWSFCTCPIDEEHGSLVFPERPVPPGWNVSDQSDMPNQIIPFVESSLNSTVNDTHYSALNSSTSFLDFTLHGRRVAIQRSPTCECVNPWDNFKDPSNSAICSVSGGVRLCLIKALGNSTGLSSSQVEKEALDLIKQIDSSFAASYPATSPLENSQTLSLNVTQVNATATSQEHVPNTVSPIPSASDASAPVVVEAFVPYVAN